MVTLNHPLDGLAVTAEHHVAEDERPAPLIQHLVGVLGCLRIGHAPPIVTQDGRDKLAYLLIVVNDESLQFPVSLARAQLSGRAR